MKINQTLQWDLKLRPSFINISNSFTNSYKGNGKANLRKQISVSVIAEKLSIIKHFCPVSSVYSFMKRGFISIIISAKITVSKELTSSFQNFKLTFNMKFM